MRSAGCTINDIWDRDIDGKGEPRSRRPLLPPTLQAYPHGCLAPLTRLRLPSIAQFVVQVSAPSHPA